MPRPLYQNKYHQGTFRAKWCDYTHGGLYFVTCVVNDRKHAFGEIRLDECGHKYMDYSPLGQYINGIMIDVTKHHKYAYIPVFQIMPDHVHFIVFAGDYELNESINAEMNGDESIKSMYSNNSDNPNNSDISNFPPNSPCNPNSPCSRVACYAATFAFDNDDNKNKSSDDNNPDDIWDEIDVPDYVPEWEMDVDINQTTSSYYASISPKRGSLAAIVRNIKSATTKHAHELGMSFEWQRRYWEKVIMTNREYVRIACYIERNVQNWKNCTK